MAKPTQSGSSPAAASPWICGLSITSQSTRCARHRPRTPYCWAHGFADVVAINDAGTHAIIGDWKTGKPRDSDQLRLYAVMLLLLCLRCNRSTPHTGGWRTTKSPVKLCTRSTDTACSTHSVRSTPGCAQQWLMTIGPNNRTHFAAAIARSKTASSTNPKGHTDERQTRRPGSRRKLLKTMEGHGDDVAGYALTLAVVAFCIHRARDDLNISKADRARAEYLRS